MEIVVAFLIGLASGTVGAISTGGGLISIPGLIFLGLSPVSAVATSRLSAVSGGLTSVFKYHKGKAVAWQFLPIFMTISVLAGLIGPRLLIEIDKDMVEKLIGVSMLVMLPILMLRKDFGITRTERDPRRQKIGLLVVFLVMIYATMFGAGGGILLVNALVFFFGLTVTESNATGTAMFLVGTIVALATYISKGEVDFSTGIPLMSGALIGGYTGAHIALKKGTVWVKWFLAVVITVASIKLILF